jgi:hypothetical protein
VFAEGTEVALHPLSVAAVVLQATAPQARVVLDAVADLAADGAFGACDVARLSPLVVYFGSVVLGDDVLAVGFA